MAWPTCGSSGESKIVRPIPVWRCMTFHDIGLALSGVLAIGTIFTSFYMILGHATHYLKPWQQRHIIRVLFIVPVYSTASFLSLLSYRYAIYIEAVRDCYEAFAIASFFALLCSYTGVDLHSQKNYFRELRPKAWMWPLDWFGKCCRGEKGIWRTPRSGLTWFNIIWFGIHQYCLIRILMSVVVVATESANRYCVESMHPAFAHLWVMLIGGGSVTGAMFCQVQFYMQLKDGLIEHKPFRKITAVKLVILLSFWQTQILSALRSFDITKPTDRLGQSDIKFGIPSFLICVEMAIFSVVHLWAYPWTDYELRQPQVATSEPDQRVANEPVTSYSGGMCGTSALLDAFNMWDMVKGVARAFKWLLVDRRRREQDVSYTNSGLAIALGPVRKVFALQFPGQENGLAHHPYYSPVNDLSQTCIGGSSTSDDSYVTPEEEASGEEENLIDKAHSNPPTSSFLPIPPNQQQTNQNSHAASNNDTNSTILPSDSIIDLQEPCFRADAPQLTLPEFHALEIGLQDQGQIKHGEHQNLASIKRQTESSISDPMQSLEEPAVSPSRGSLESLRR